MFRVFLGAPSTDFLRSAESESVSFSWQTFAAAAQPLQVIPVDTYNAASVRISNFYQNTIFHDDEEVDDESTAITWLPTPQEGVHDTTSRANVTFPSFLLHDTSTSTSVLETELYQAGQDTQPSSPSISISRTQSFSYSRSNLDLSHSIAHFPSFQFNPNSLSSLSLLARVPAKVNLLLAVMEVDGPDMVKIKKGKDAGKEVGVLRMIVGDEEGRVGKLTAWREVAVAWCGGAEGSTAVKRGDVVLIEGVNGTRDVQTSPSLTASPYLGSKLTICYRTLPRENGDHRLRPDLRLGESDAAVGKVAAVVKWFEQMAGL